MTSKAGDKGYLHIVGVGPSDEDGMSIGARRAIEQADELWMIDLGPPNQERTFLRKLLDGKRKLVNLSGHYHTPACPRKLHYLSVAHRLLHLVQRGRQITFLVSGNPLYWTIITDIFKGWTHLVELRITPSMSFLDVMYLETPFAGRTLQVRLSTITEPDISPELDCLIGQIGDDHTNNLFGQSSAMSALTKNLRRFYSSGHPIYLFGNHSVDGEPKFRAATIATLPRIVPEFAGWHFSALIPAVGRAKTSGWLNSDDLTHLFTSPAPARRAGPRRR